LCFRQDFKGDNVFGASFARQVDFAEFTPAEGFADFKVVERPSGACFGGLFLFGLG
jgi:hypothetical protein